MKTLLTALLSVQMLGKVFSRWQWLSQLLLMVGIVLVQLGDQAPAQKAPAAADGAAAAEPPSRSLGLGLAAVLLAAFSSSFASVYFERLLKGTSKEGASKEGAGGKEPPGSPTRAAASSLWHKNMQLCAWTVPSNLLLAVLQSSATEDGALAVLWSPTQGFEWSTWG